MTLPYISMNYDVAPSSPPAASTMHCILSTFEIMYLYLYFKYFLVGYLYLYSKYF